MTALKSNINITVLDLKHFCEQNFFRKEGQIVIYAIVGLQHQSSLINRIHPQDLIGLSERNFDNLFCLIKFLRDGDESVKELFGAEWLESIYNIAP